jgi:hypothetical protein
LQSDARRLHSDITTLNTPLALFELESHLPNTTNCFLLPPGSSSSSTSPLYSASRSPLPSRVDLSLDSSLDALSGLWS